MYLRTLLIAILWLAQLPATAQEPELPFVDMSLSDAYSVAHDDGKVLMVVFGTEYCAPCRRLEREVFSNKEVAAYLDKNAVAKYIDLSVRSGQSESKYINPGDGRIGEHYGILGFPVVIFSSAKEAPEDVDYPLESGRILGLRYTAEDGWLDVNIQSTSKRAELQKLWEQLSDPIDKSAKASILVATYFAAIKENIALAGSD